MMFANFNKWLESCYEEDMKKGVILETHSFAKIWLLISCSPHTRAYSLIVIDSK